MLFLDNSAWARFDSALLTAERREELAGLIQAGQLAVSLPFLLEAGYSARSAAHRNELMDELSSFHIFEITAEVSAQALALQAELAKVGHHRVAPSDLIIAALAVVHRAGVLHYDKDYDVIAEKAGAEFDGVWLAPRGTL